MIELLVTENRSKDPVRFARNRVRVFIGKDNSYGLWVDEDRLFDLLTLEQRKDYLTIRNGSLQFKITLEVARRIVDQGYTVENKQRILNRIGAHSNCYN